MGSHINSFIFPQRQLLPGSFENQPDPRSTQLLANTTTKNTKEMGKSVHSLNEILNCATLTLKAPYTGAKGTEKLFTTTRQQLTFPCCAVLMEMLAPWDKNEEFSPGGFPRSFLSRTLVMLMRCSQTQHLKLCKLGSGAKDSFLGRNVPFSLVLATRLFAIKKHKRPFS